MEVILLQNTLLKGKRFDAGSKVVVDVELGKRLIAHRLASEVTRIDPDPVVVDPDENPKPRRRVARKKVAQ